MGKGKTEKTRMDVPPAPPPPLIDKDEAEKKDPPETETEKEKKKKARPKKFDFTMNGLESAKVCPICRNYQTERIGTKDNIQYRKCLNQNCRGNPRDGNKKTYKVVGKQI